MTEPAKTILLCCVALATAVAAVVLTREGPQETAQSRVGHTFVDIPNPQDVTSLKIVRFDEATGKPDAFEVTKTKKGYTIPSHENYPADAKQHLADAAVSVSHLEILSSVGESRALHKEFGVLDPNDPALKLGATGVGTRVTLGGASGQPLADFIIGNKVEGRPGLRYVRHADMDQVYTVQIDTKDLSTDFGVWIEKDLLAIDPLDLSQIVLKDYAVEVENVLVKNPITGQAEAVPQPMLNYRSQVDLSYNDKDLKWGLDKLLVFKNGKPVSIKLAKDEELNQQRLEDLKTALDDLKIADVHRKPGGLSGDLADFIRKNPAAEESLNERGFYPLPTVDPTLGPVVSDQGEVLARMHNGVEYILRFGNVAGGEKSPDQKTDKDKPPAEGEKLQATKFLRYLFVMARFDPDLVTKPEYEAVPELLDETQGKPQDHPQGEKPDGATPNGAKPNDVKAKDAKPAAKKTIPVKPVADKPADKTNDKLSAAAADASQDKPKAATEKTGTNKASTEKTGAEKTSPENAGTEKPGPEKQGTAKTGAAKKPGSSVFDRLRDAVKSAITPDEPKRDPKAEAAARKALRGRIIRANDFKKKDYEMRLADGEKKVKELNQRFAPWYYVISDDVYQKIHLGQKDVVRKKPPKTEPVPPGPPPFGGLPPGLAPPGGGAP